MGYKGFPRRIRELKPEGVSLRQYLEDLHLTYANLHAWEKLGKTPTITTVQRIADIIHVSPSWLAFGEGSKTHPNYS